MHARDDHEADLKPNICSLSDKYLPVDRGSYWWQYMPYDEIQKVEAQFRTSEQALPMM
jgi:hypothetical protein